MTEKRIVIIGGGPGGYAAALRAAALGAQVTLVENHYIGGTCLNYGCIPSKIMKTSADLYDKIKHAENYGLKLNGTIDPDLSALMARKKKIILAQRNAILSLLKKSRIDVYQGRGVIKGRKLAGIIDADGREKEIAFDSLLIAAGSKPMNVGAFPFDGKYILSSNDLLELKKIPASILIAGGGVIGCEFAFILAALGTKVTIIEAMSRILPQDSIDDSCARVLHREMKKRKIKVITDKSVKKAVVETAVSEPGLCVTLGPSPFSDQKEKSLDHFEKIKVEKMAVCIGRSPLSADIGLENAGIHTDTKGWISANDKMETSVQDIYALGDILGPEKIMLAHTAVHEGFTAAENAMGGNKKMNYRAVPGAVFTMPEIGCVGITKAQAEEKGLDAATASVQFRSLGKAHATGEISGEAKLIFHKKTKHILGAHIIGPCATDLISLGALAVNRNLTINDLADTVQAHPTLGEIWFELSMKAAGKPLHG